MTDGGFQTNELKYIPNESEGECLLSKINPIRFNKIKFTFFVIASIIFGGIPVLLIHWYTIHDLGIAPLEKLYTMMIALWRRALMSTSLIMISSHLFAS